MAYFLVSHDNVLSPVDEELYEYDEETDTYSLSEDEEVDPTVDYYFYYDEGDESEDVSLFELADVEGVENPAEELLYEYDSETEQYFVTGDEEVVDGKDYYVFIGDTIDYDSYNEDDDYYPVYLEDEEPGAVDNPAAAGLYVRVDDEDSGYVLTSDTVYNEDTLYYRKYDEEIEDVEEDFIEEYDETIFSDLRTSSDFGNTYRPTENEEQPENIPAGELYIRVNVAYVKDPTSQDLYELSDSTYSLTADTAVDPYKAYYKKIDLTEYFPVELEEGSAPVDSVVYEVSNGEYVLSIDSEIVENKTYYRYVPLVEDYYEWNDNPDDEAYALGEFDGVPSPPGEEYDSEEDEEDEEEQEP